MRNRRPRKVQGVAASIHDDFRDIGIGQFRRVVDAPVQRGDLHRRIDTERRDELVHRPRIEQRLVTLHVDDDVAIQRGGDLGQTVRAGLVRRFREPHPPAECVHTRRNAQIVGGDDDLRHNRGRRHTPVHVLDHRTAVDIGESFPGKTRRSVSGGDDGDNVQRRNRIDS